MIAYPTIIVIVLLRRNGNGGVAQLARACGSYGTASREELLALGKQVFDEVKAAITPEAQQVITCLLYTSRRVHGIRDFFNTNKGYLLIIDEADKLVSKYTQKKMEILRAKMCIRDSFGRHRSGCRYHRHRPICAG